MLSVFHRLYIVAALLSGLMVQAYAAQDPAKIGQASLLINKDFVGMSDVMRMYCMQGMKIKFKDPAGRIHKLIGQHETTLQWLKTNLDDATAKAAIKKSETAWESLKSKLNISEKGSQATKGSALEVYSGISGTMLPLLKLNDALFKQETDQAQYTYAAGGIGGLGKQLATLYVMKVWKLSDPRIDQYWKDRVMRIQKGFAFLKKSSYYQDPVFAKKLASCEKELKFFKMMYQMDKGAPTIVDSKSNRILKASQEMVKMILKAK